VGQDRKTGNLIRIKNIGGEGGSQTIGVRY